MPVEGFATVRRALEESLAVVTRDLFAAYDIALDHRPEASSHESPSVRGELVGVSVIGFAGEKVRGALVLLAPVAAVRTWQHLSEDAPEEVVRDTIGEFSNMLLGRLKNRLLSRGVVLLLATPTSAFGRELSMSSPPADQARWQLFEGDGGPVYARISASFEPGFVLGEAPDGVEAVSANEGEMMLF
jgi:CheY-specific phosphatase CheX